MKTAISVPDEVFREVEKVAKERHSSRSEVIVTAVKEYLERRKSSALLSALNQAYGTAETTEEYEVRKKAKKRYGRVLRRERS
ncbi:MAG: CopG family ribbon-helix-helix protein [Betaproteobacteria bacterium]